MFMEGHRGEDEGGVVGLVPYAKRNAIDECFSPSPNLTKHLNGYEKQRDENKGGAALGSPPQAIWGHYRLLSDIQ